MLRPPLPCRVTHLLPLVKQDVAKAQNYARQLEGKIFEETATREAWVTKINVKLKGVQQKVVSTAGGGRRGYRCGRTA